METIFTPQLATALATALLHSLWQCAFLAAAAAMTLQLLSRHSAALRHTVGMGFLLAMVGLPALWFVQFWLQPAGDLNNGIPLATAARRLGAALRVFGQQSSGWPAMALSALWLLGVTSMLLRHLGGLWWIRTLERRDFQHLAPEWQDRLDALQRTMGITRKVVVRVTEDVLMPFTARLLRPVIWMPRALLSRLPHEQIVALFAHELAHIKRFDWLWNALQCVIEALLFFHPAMWWLSRRIREEREHACDDHAVTAHADAIALAEALTELARGRQTFPRLALTAIRGPLMTRITRLLSGPPAPTLSWAPIGLISILTASAVLAAQLAPGRAGTRQPLPFAQEVPAIVRLVAENPSVIAKIGSRAIVPQSTFTGKWGRYEGIGQYGYVRVSFGMKGPKGEATILVTAIAMEPDRQWKLTELNVSDFKPAR